MENSRKSFILMRHQVQISKEHSLKTHEDRALTEKISYASMIGSILYDLHKTKCDIYFKYYSSEKH